MHEGNTVAVLLHILPDTGPLCPFQCESPKGIFIRYTLVPSLVMPTHRIFMTQASVKYPYNTLTIHIYSTHLSSFIKSAYMTKPFSGAEPSWHNNCWSMGSKNLKLYNKNKQILMIQEAKLLAKITLGINRVFFGGGGQHSELFYIL